MLLKLILCSIDSKKFERPSNLLFKKVNKFKFSELFVFFKIKFLTVGFFNRFFRFSA